MFAAVLAGYVACVEYGVQDPDRATPSPVDVEERFVQAPLPGLDVLFVVDSTGSMAEEQTAFSAGAVGFVETLDTLGLTYQLGVTRTDAETRGALVGRPWIVTPQADDPAGALAAALRVGTDGAAPAAGLDAAALALRDEDGLNRGFRRDDAALHVIFLSDGDDESGALLGADPYGAFLATLAEEAARTGRAARASAVVGDVPDGCVGTGGQALPGTRYAAVAEASGGAVHSVCDADLSGVASGLGDVGVEWATEFPLQADPDDASVRVEVDGVRSTSGWSIDHAVPALVFDVPPAPDAEILVAYTLAEAE